MNIFSKSNKPLNQSGFTLIELLVVVAVIGLLVGVVGISAFEVRENSRKKAVSADLSVLKGAMERYRNKERQLPTSTSQSFSWEDVLDALNREDFLPNTDTYKEDPWDEEYKFYNNYRGGTKITTFETSVNWSANDKIKYSDGIPSMICSLGSDDSVTTSFKPGNSDTAGFDGANGPYIETGRYGSEDDNVCIFLYDKD